MSDSVAYTSKVLLKFSPDPKDFWTIDDATKGISIMGGTGSGKTSASGKKLAETFLKEGWGGLVLCAKTDEALLWKQYCKEAGRENDLIIFGNGSKLPDSGEEIVFNPIDYEMKRSGIGGGQTQNITNIFMNIYRMGNRIASEGDTKEERYWDTALKRCLNRVIELLKLSGEDLSYSNMVKVLTSSNNIDKDKFSAATTKWEQDGDIPGITEPSNYCLQCLLMIYFESILDKDANSETLNSWQLVRDYFTEAMPNMGSRTKSVVTESFMGLAEPFMSGLLYKHFSGKTNIFPEWIFEQHKIIVLDFPIKEYLDAGIISQCVFKLLFQQAVERRDISQHPTPAFLWADEAHYFVNPYDQIFLTTARSARVATVMLSQNISNYFAVMGSGSDAKARVDSLMGNLCTKIFHANSDAETNEYASRLLGSTLTTLANSGEQHTTFGLSGSSSKGTSSQFLPQIQPKEFTVLKTGGKSNDFEVHGVLTVNGKQWANGKNYLKLTFEQKFNN